MIFRNKNKIKYSLAPQTKFYDSMAAKWKPFVMFNQYPNIRSEFCNTDKYGLRFNKVTKKNLKSSIFEQYDIDQKDQAIIIGNSLSFGEGQTADDKTISSILSEDSKYNFYNLSGRGFSGYQEIMNFLKFRNKFKRLKKIIIISGLNDSYLPFFIKNQDEFINSIFGYERFSKAMGKSTRGWKNVILKMMLNKFLKKDDEVWERVNALNWREELLNESLKFIDKKTSESSLEIMNKIIKNNLETWKILAAGMNIQIDFVLQPVGSWCKNWLMGTTFQMVERLNERNGGFPLLI